MWICHCYSCCQGSVGPLYGGQRHTGGQEHHEHQGLQG